MYEPASKGGSPANTCSHTLPILLRNGTASRTPYRQSPAFAALGPSLLAKVSHMTCREAQLSKVPGTGDLDGRNT